MPKRRANGEGNIRKRKDGRWEGRYTAGVDPETGVLQTEYPRIHLVLPKLYEPAHHPAPRR